MYLYLQKQNLNFATTLTKQILTNENAIKIDDTKIKEEKSQLKQNEAFLKIDYLTIMILGVTGLGNSTLVNSLLKLKKPEAALVGYGDIKTTETKIFNSKKVPFLHLVDTRGIELDQEYSVKSIGINADEFINGQLEKKNINEVVHCIWYCVESDRFQENENELVQNLMNTLNNYEKNNHIPVIMVLTKCKDIDHVNEMKSYLHDKDYEGVIAILAKRVKLVNGTYLESFGLDRLLQRTLKRCKEALLGDMRKIMINQTTSHIKDELKNNKRKKESIIKIMKSDAVDDDLANKNIEDFLCRIYRYNISKYLDVNDMGNATYSLIINSQFKEHRINFFANCQKYENSIIESVLPSYALKFLDNEATKEKEYKIAVEYINKRNYLDFMNTTKKFLEDNFNYFSSKYYIYYIINIIFE